MTLPHSKMPHLHARLLLLFLLFCLLPQPSLSATSSKSRREDESLGSSNLHRLGSDADVYLTGQQEHDLLKSQEPPDISERIPQVHQKKENLKDAHKIALCPARRSWPSMVLAVFENGTLVQIPESNEWNQEEWFIQEECDVEVSPILGGVSCQTREFFVIVYVFPLEMDSERPFQRVQLKINVCESVYG